MASVINIFIVITAIIILGYVSELIFRKTRIPDVIFLIGAGIALRAAGWIEPGNFGFSATLFATFALVFLLFQGAINIDFKTLFASFRGAFGITIVSFVLTTIVGTVLGMLTLGLGFGLALMLGMMIGGTSSAVVIPLVGNIPIEKRNKSILMLESAISDVLCIVGVVTMITILTTGTVSGSDVIQKIIASFAIAIVIGLAAGFVWMLVLAKSRELASSQMVTIAVIIGLYALIESPFVGASGAIGVLAFGLILGNSKELLELMFSKKRDTEASDIVMKKVLSSSSKNFYDEISFFVKVFFFVYLGILIDFSQPLIFLWGFIITAGIYLARPLAVKFIFRKEKLNDLNRTILEVLVPKGLAAAVLAQLAIQSGVPGAETLATPVFAVILISIIATSVLVFLADHGMFRGFGDVYFGRKKEEI